MLDRITGASVRLVDRYLPDPLILAILLTFVVFLGGMALGSGPVAMVEFWGNGFWGLLTFSMQMVLILVTGFVLATTPVFRRILAAIASLARTPVQAILLVTLVALVASWINWGFGLVIGALFARQLAQRVPTVDYRLLIASAYSGFVVWHAGLAGSVPLVIATEGHFTAHLIGVIPTDQTIFASFNLILVAALFVVIPLLNVLMVGKGGAPVHVDPAKLRESEALPDAGSTHRPADRLETSRALSLIVGFAGLAYLANYFLAQGGTLNLNIVNFLFLMLGILLHGTPRRFLAAVTEAVKGAAGIIVQFPFYAGIMGMMTGSGMAEALSRAFVAISTPETLPLWTFLSAGLVNLFVPSGGGQWAVQAPIMLPAALDLGADVARVAMAVAWGDAWTNLIQPFWALPALAIAGLKARDIMGFCLIVLAVTGVVIGVGLVVL
ncbi:MAG: short-chain fatty acid transporter [Geminicoccaceae bacterium]|nr:MAG: short-chain fatty acid transporter [Geminicoccaceae bacterium]